MYLGTLTKQHLLVWCDATMTPRAGIESQVQGIDYIIYIFWRIYVLCDDIILCNSKSPAAKLISAQANRYEWDFVGKRNEAAHHYDRGSRSSWSYKLGHIQVKKSWEQLLKPIINLSTLPIVKYVGIYFWRFFLRGGLVTKKLNL